MGHDLTFCVIGACNIELVCVRSRQGGEMGISDPIVPHKLPDYGKLQIGPWIVSFLEAVARWDPDAPSESLERPAFPGGHTSSEIHAGPPHAIFNNGLEVKDAPDETEKPTEVHSALLGLLASSSGGTRSTSERIQDSVEVSRPIDASGDHSRGLPDQDIISDAVNFDEAHIWLSYWVYYSPRLELFYRCEEEPTHNLMHGLIPPHLPRRCRTA